MTKIIARTMTEVMQDIDYASMHSQWRSNKMQRETICTDIKQLKLQLSSLEKFLQSNDYEAVSGILHPNRFKVSQNTSNAA